MKNNGVVLTETDLAEFRVSKERMDKYTKLYDGLRDKILAAAAREKRKVLRRGGLSALVKEEERRRPDYEKVLFKLKGEKFIKRLIAKTKPQIIRKVMVVNDSLT